MNKNLTPQAARKRDLAGKGKKNGFHRQLGKRVAAKRGNKQRKKMHEQICMHKKMQILEMS